MSPAGGTSLWTGTSPVAGSRCEAGNAFAAAEIDLNLADVLVSQGRVDEADSLLRGAIRVLRAFGMNIEAAYGHSLLAKVALARGDFAAAEDSIVPVIDEMLASGHTMTALEASLVLAEALTRSGRPGDALAVIGDAEQAARGGRRVAGPDLPRTGGSAARPRSA